MFVFAEIALNLPLQENDTLTYEIPHGMKVKVGSRVIVPLQKRDIEGIIIEIHSNEPNYKIKQIKRLIDKEPVLNEEQIKLGNWMKDNYFSTLGESLYKMIPSGRRNIVKEYKELDIKNEIHTLNSEQENAFQNIYSDFGKEAVHLLYGVTGSGKTEVYIHLIDRLMKETDKSAIFLVPEISLTVQILRRLELVFGNRLAILHSALKVSDKFRSYLSLLRGEKRIAVGTRSAVFAPVKNVGLIIIDEEHDHSYKEHSSPRYHARQVAFQRAKMNHAVVVLGSATPSIEAFYFGKKGNIKISELKKRAKATSLPNVILSEQKDPGQILGSDLLFKIKERLDRKEQVILLLNRRGHSPMVYLKNEKKFLECPNCSTNLCYHKSRQVICHLCGYKDNIITLEKKYGEIELMGAGTQKLEEYILDKFPDARLERLDQDTTKDRSVLSEVIGRLIDGEIDILTGTQMIAKGLDASRVTLVGVINAGIGLGLPDFRSGEKIFSLLTQVAGRAGRADLAGEVVIETPNISHPVIQLAKNQNYDKFFDEEIEIRKKLGYPPFSRLIRFVSRSKDEAKSLKAIEIIKEALFSVFSKDSNVLVLGPVACPFYKIDSSYRNHIIIKSTRLSETKDKVKEVLLKLKTPSGVYMEVDLDPMDLL